METTQTRDKLLSVEEVWAILQETNRTLDRVIQKQEETNRTLDQVIQKQEETNRALDRVIQKQEENAQRQAETDKRIGESSNSFGEMDDFLDLPNLMDKFEELGFSFTMEKRPIINAGIPRSVFAEVSALLENGDKVMVVKIEIEPSTDDIKDHIERMDKFRVRADLSHDKRVYLAAMAGVVFSDNVKTFALKNGFYVIEPSGDSFTITVPEGEYHRREW